MLEPTGSYSTLVVRFAQQQGRTVYQAPPAAAQSCLSVLHPRTKTDRLDSSGLARFALARRLHRFRLPTAAQRTVASLLADLERRHTEVMTRLRAAVAGDAALQAAVARLQAVPGIGELTAISLGLSLVQIPFRRAAAFVAYLGLDVRVRQSGQWRGKGRLNKRGPARLRQLLYLAAQAALRVRREPAPFRMQYERERAKGLPSTAALCAVARKLAKVCWSLVHHQCCWDPERVYAQPAAA